MRQLPPQNQIRIDKPRSKSRSRSRSRSHERDPSDKAAAGLDLSNMMGQKLDRFNLLKSPAAAEQAIKRTHVMNEIDIQFQKEDEQRPALKMRYGVRKRDGSPLTDITRLQEKLNEDTRGQLEQITQFNDRKK